MTLMAICSAAFPDVIILTFELMSNHLHIVFAGDGQRGEELFEMFRNYLGKYLRGVYGTADLSSWGYKVRQVSSLSDARNVIAYDNRNGYLVHSSCTPFSYPWGANRFFFNPDARLRSSESSEVLSVRLVRALFHTHELDKYAGQKMVDGYVSPMEFCRVGVAEALYRNAWQYFYKVSRDIESNRELASELGERIFYTDEELKSVVYSICNDQYNVSLPSMLPKDAKLEVARKLHYDYNSTNKQIVRMLRLDSRLVDSLFPAFKG